MRWCISGRLAEPRTCGGCLLGREPLFPGPQEWRWAAFLHLRTQVPGCCLASGCVTSILSQNLEPGLLVIESTSTEMWGGHCTPRTGAMQKILSYQDSEQSNEPGTWTQTSELGWLWFCFQNLLRPSSSSLLGFCYWGDPRQGAPHLGSCLAGKRQIQAGDDTCGGNEAAGVSVKHR